MNELKTIGYLLTAGGSIFGTGGIHTLYERDNEIVEELWDGVKVQSEASVGDGVKGNAPMVYGIACDGEIEQRFVFSVGPDNRIKAFVFDTEEEEWDDYDLGNEASRAIVHPKSALAADSSPDGLVTVFFVNAHCKLQMLLLQPGGDWTIGPELADTCPRAGTPLSVVPMEDERLVWYLGVDNVMHYHAQKLDSDCWQDHRWGAVTVEEPIQRFKVDFDADSGRFEAFLLAEGRLLRFDGDSPQQEVGRMKGRELILNNTAQSVRITFIRSGIVVRYGRIIGWESKRRTTRRYKDGSVVIYSRTRFYPV